MHRKMHYKKCEMCGLRSGRDSDEKRTFLAQFPLDEERCKQWVKLTAKEDLAYVPIEKLHSLKYLCGHHFDKKYFNRKGTRLKNTAIPSKNLPGNELPDEMLANFPCHIASHTTSASETSQQGCSTSQHLDVTCQSQGYGSPPGLSDSLSKETYLYGRQPADDDFRPSPIPVSEVLQPPPAYTETESPSRLAETPVLVPALASPTEPPPRTVVITPEPSTSSAKQEHWDHDYCSPQILSNDARSPLPGPSTSTDEQLYTDHCSHTMPLTPESRKRKRSLLSDTEITPRKKKLVAKLKKCKLIIKSLKQGNVMKNIKSLALKTLIRAYIRNRKRKPQGKRWTPLEKGLALAIYKKSPRTYRYLKHIIALPSMRTLQTLLQGVDLEPGISPTVVNHLQKKTENMTEKDKLCVLLFDEMALKKRLIYNRRTDKVEGFVDLGSTQYRTSEIADHALVFMLQGIHKKMKQPIAYYFVQGTISSQSLAALIKNVIKTITDIGYTIVATVCDQGPTNIGSLNLLKRFNNIPDESNYFYVENGKKVYIMFDVPHLLKSIRNNFYQGGVIVMNGKKGKWSHLIELEERNKSTLHFKKITSLHVNPKFRSKMKVKLAAQVLSNTVAAILKLLAETYGDDEKGTEIRETAEIIEDLDRLFDCTNGPASRNDIIRNRRQNVSRTSNHKQLWAEFKTKIKTLHFLKSDSQLRLRNVRCVQGYITSISSLEDIWRYVESHGFKYLNLRQLNQDALENLFGMIRQHCPTNKNPTCHHFTAALKANILTKMSTPISRGANCEEDTNEAIIDLQDFIKPPNTKRTNTTAEVTTETVPEEIDPEVPVLEIPEIDAEDNDMENEIFNTFEKQPTVYVAGYLASAVLKNLQWQCEDCKNCLKVEDPQPCPLYNYISLREWWKEKNSLTYPTINLCQLVDKTTEVFERMKQNLHEYDISKQTVTMMLLECDNLPWVCKDHKNKLLDILLVRLSHLLIRNECHRINQTFVATEETIADINKKAQQQGTAK